MLDFSGIPIPVASARGVLDGPGYIAVRWFDWLHFAAMNRQ